MPRVVNRAWWVRHGFRVNVTDGGVESATDTGSGTSTASPAAVAEGFASRRARRMNSLRAPWWSGPWTTFAIWLSLLCGMVSALLTMVLLWTVLYGTAMPGFVGTGWIDLCSIGVTIVALWRRGIRARRVLGLTSREAVAAWNATRTVGSRITGGFRAIWTAIGVNVVVGAGVVIAAAAWHALTTVPTPVPVEFHDTSATVPVAQPAGPRSQVAAGCIQGQIANNSLVVMVRAGLGGPVARGVIDTGAEVSQIPSVYLDQQGWTPDHAVSGRVGALLAAFGLNPAQQETITGVGGGSMSGDVYTGKLELSGNDSAWFSTPTVQVLATSGPALPTGAVALVGMRAVSGMALSIGANTWTLCQ